MDAGESPTHDLKTIQALIRTKRYVPTDGVLESLMEIGLEECDIEACVLALVPDDFYKTMESTKRPGLWQDVYRPTYQGEWLYVKLQIAKSAERCGLVVVLSFKRKFEN